MNFRKGNEHYYYISRVVLLILLVMVAGFVTFRIYIRGREKVTYDGGVSTLSDETKCYLCGNADDSMMPYYRKFNTLGILFLNDWNILELEHHSGTRIGIGATEEYRYESSSMPSQGEAEINVTFEEGYKPDVESLQNRLCQTCLDKVLGALEFDRLTNQKEEAMPLCLVDFQTLEIYSVQNLEQKLYLDKWCVMTQAKNDKLKIEMAKK